MAFAIKAEVVDPRARTFAFTAQKTMYRLGLSSISNSIGKQLTRLSASRMKRRRSSASASKFI